MDNRRSNLNLDGSGTESIVQLGLPQGWKREENTRQGGLSAGRVDVYYISPDGKKFWTKPQLARHFGESVDLGNFDFHTGRFTSNSIRSSIVERLKLNSHATDYSKYMKNDATLVTPIRQTASIFKQPVTIVKTHKSRVKMDFKLGVQESPRQLFWEKRLQGLRASDPSGAELLPSELPSGIVPAGPGIDSDTVLHSIATALHLATHPITGQSGNKTTIEENPGVFINPDQPLIHEMLVNEDDIRAQEEKVALARKRLEEALLSFYPSSTVLRVPINSEPEQTTDYEKVTNNGPNVNGVDNSIHLSQNPHKKLRVCQKPQGYSIHPQRH